MLQEAPNVVREDQRTDFSHQVAAQSLGGNGAVLNLLGALLLDSGEPWLGVGTLRNEVVKDVAPPSRARCRYHRRHTGTHARSFPRRAA